MPADTPRATTPPEQTSINVRRQAPAPGLQDDAGNPYPVDPNVEPENTVDRDDQPVADRARGQQGMWDRQDADPDAPMETGDEVEIRTIKKGDDNG